MLTRAEGVLESPVRARKHAVLCVDDDPWTLAALRRALRNEPYDVLTAESPTRALHLVATRRISLVLSDHRMPILSGLELLQVIHEEFPGILGVLLTGYPESLPFDELGAGVRRVFLKPWDNETLVRSLRDLLSNRTSLWTSEDEEDGPESPDLGGEG